MYEHMNQGDWRDIEIRNILIRRGRLESRQETREEAWNYRQEQRRSKLMGD